MGTEILAFAAEPPLVPLEVEVLGDSTGLFRFNKVNKAAVCAS